MKYFFKVLFSLIVIFLVLSCKNQNESASTAPETTAGVNFDDPWKQADAIVESIKIPIFRDEVFNVLDYGASADGSKSSDDAFKKAIEACSNAGGGKVFVPAGVYHTGPIHLKSNINLHLEEGAEVKFSTSHQDYLPVVHTSYEGMEFMNYSPLIYAYKQKNIAVTGKGTFNGQAGNENWWPWSGKDVYGYKEGDVKQHDTHNLPRLSEMVEKGTPVEERIFGEGHQFRPTFFEPFECENVLIEGVTFINAPFWVMHPIKSSNITVKDVSVISHGPNNDGCNPEYSQNVHITGCLFDTGDDCIAIKSGRDNDGRRVGISSENIVVENCTMKDGHGGVVMGSEISGGVRNVYVRNNTMNSPNLDRAIRIKTNTRRGGTIENIFVKDLKVGQVKEAVLKINTHYGIYANQEGGHMPVIRNILLENVEVENGGEYGVLILGREQSPVSNVKLKNVNIKNVEVPLRVEHADDIIFENTTINGKEY
ncbi:glycoside hydrolase family 28 protein [Salinimicrobium sp. MT39]|uniref:Glycoside hydrolase family 28 protein n=1 Tax=Salinimicrobium profundisediminis TaxID=2994553 RepID=A0A9X3CWU5_9FLAO|nr:glycoside hydrolase family 28 protein [Salinimicrobium profundisediminis]MCX2838243.1 glycoside hydrolase family 28 protein [Salinimicrobium profundisediminis]